MQKLSLLTHSAFSCTWERDYVCTHVNIVRNEDVTTTIHHHSIRELAGTNIVLGDEIAGRQVDRIMDVVILSLKERPFILGIRRK